MKLHSFIFIFITQLSAVASQSPPSATTRRILHEPLFPAAATPPPDDDVVTQFPPPPPDSSVAADPDQPFFPEIPNGAATQVQNPTLPPPPADASAVIPAATQPAKPVKKVAMVISVGIVTLGMLSALAFYIYRHKAKHPDSQKLMASDSRNYGDESCRDPPSSFFHMGTVDSSANRSEDSAIANTSPYHKLNSVKKLDRYRPSPDLQPLPPLRRQPPHPPARSSPTATVFSSSEDEGSRDANFYTPYGSGAGFDDGFSTPVSKQSRRSKKNSVSNGGGMPLSKVASSPKSRFSASSPDVVKHAIIPSIKTNPPPPPPPPQEPPGLQPLPPEKEIGPLPQIKSVLPTKVKFTTPPSPPNSALLQSISKQSHKTGKAPPPPPPPPPPMSIPPKVRSTWTNAPLRPSGSSSKAKLQTSTPEFQKEDLKPEEAKAKPNEDVENGCIYSGRPDGDEMEGTKLKLKPLHWDKVRATSDRATVWDQLKSSSFQLNEDMIESLFGCNSIPNNSSNSANKDATRRSVLPPVEQENRVLDPKKSQNIAILLRALNVTRDEVSQALLEGNPEALGAELLETLVKMAPTKEEEIKLKDYKGDTSKLGSAEKFLIAILDIPFAFKRVEAMLYRANFDAEVKYLRKSFDTLETASDELKKNRLFLKLLEAVLRTGNRMNVGTNRGDAKAFKLDTLLKLVDIKGTDGKTTLLHFVVQEIIKSEDIGSETTTVNFKNQTNSKGLHMVSGLSRELGSVKLAAGMDSDVLHSYVSKLETGLEKVKTVLHLERPDMQGGFFESMRGFLGKAEEEISRIKDDERRVLTVVREVTEYFHGNAAKEEAHPFRIFMIVRDFLTALDQVCKEVGRMHDRTITSARSFRMSTNAPLPVLNRYNVSQDDDWSEDSSSS